MMPTPLVEETKIPSPQKQLEEDQQAIAIAQQEEEKFEVICGPEQLQEPTSSNPPVEAVGEEQGEELQQLQEEEMIMQETQ